MEGACTLRAGWQHVPPFRNRSSRGTSVRWSCVRLGPILIVVFMFMLCLLPPTSTSASPHPEPLEHLGNTPAYDDAPYEKPPGTSRLPGSLLDMRNVREHWMRERRVDEEMLMSGGVEVEERGVTFLTQEDDSTASDTSDTSDSSYDSSSDSGSSGSSSITDGSSGWDYKYSYGPSWSYENATNGYAYLYNDNELDVLHDNEIEREGRALELLYKELNGVKWTHQKNWMKGVPCDERKGVINTYNVSSAITLSGHHYVPTYQYWEGVSCSLYRNTVVMIDIPSGSGVSGVFPDIFDKIPNLSYLSITNTNITGPLPKSFGRHESLTYVSLEGQQITSLPTITALQKLSLLLLGGNELTYCEPTLSTLTSLEVLSLEANYLKNIDGCLSPNLVHLDIAYNQIDHLPSNPSEFVTIPLQALDISGNKWPSFPLIIQQMYNLTYFVLEDASLHGEPWKDFNLGNLTDMRTFSFRNNKFTGMVPAWSMAFTNILEVDLSHNRFTGPAPPDDIYISCNVNLCFNRFPVMRYINYSHNQLTGSLPSSINTCISVEVVDFSHNLLTGPIDVIGPPYTVATPNQWLYNQSSPGLINLLQLDMSYNKMSGSMELFATSSSRLEQLSASNNYITGEMPKYSTLTNLEKMDVSHNYITGSIPTKFYDLVGLTHLDLSHNRLHGTLDGDIGKLSRMRNMWLHHNRFHGPLPIEISKLEKLTKLDIRSNLFTGFLPRSMASLCAAEGGDHVRTSGNDFVCFNPSGYDCGSEWNDCRFAWWGWVWVVFTMSSVCLMIASWVVSAWLHHRHSKMQHQRLRPKEDAPTLFARKRFLARCLMITCTVESLGTVCVLVLSLYLIYAPDLDGSVSPLLLLGFMFIEIVLLARAVCGFVGCLRYRPAFLKTYHFSYFVCVIAVGVCLVPGNIRSNSVYDIIIVATVLITHTSRMIGDVVCVFLIDLCVVTGTRFKLDAVLIPDRGGASSMSRETLAEIKTKPWYIWADDVVLQRCIGSGGFGSVYRGKWRGTTVAVKRMHAHYEELCATALDEFVSEMTTMSVLRHPNVVQFIGASLEPPDHMLVTEIVALGSLRRVLDDTSLDLSWELRLGMAMDAARGMVYLHSQSPPLLHRDLKSPNLLVTATFVVKVADFGLAKESTKQAVAMTQVVGTPIWTAPEVLAGSNYDEMADVYSFAIVMWELLTRRFPFEDEEGFSILYLVAQGQRPSVSASLEQAHPRYVKLMKTLWSPEPSDRLSFSDILGELTRIYCGSFQGRSPLGDVRGSSESIDIAMDMRRSRMGR